ncbi:lipid hydroperoxide peroxidase [cyanobacterium TDX16]|nr:lipid hydroperoxide peroxidase [cyanobacterium TDX16]
MSRTCTLKGNPLDLAGPELKVGDAAPEAVLKKSLVDDFKISESAGKARIFSVVPSLDTPVCAEQTRRFNKEVANLPNVNFFTISCDLPVAMSRFCGAEGINTERMKTLSDHKETSFGQAYGVLIPKLRILSRAVFVVDASNKLRYVEYVPEVANHPNYEAILACVKGL